MDVVTGAFSYTGSFPVAAEDVAELVVQLLTRDEVRWLELGLLVSSEPPTARRRFSDFVSENADVLGRAYVSEPARNFRPYAAV